MDTNTLESLILYTGVASCFDKHFSPVLYPKESQNPKNLKTKFVTSTDRWFHLAEMQKQANQKLEFPYLYLKLTSVSTAEQMSGDNLVARNLYRFGSYGGVNANNTTINRHRLIPADFEVEVYFITDDYIDVTRYINRWMFGAVNKALNFTANFDDISLSIRVNLNQTAQIAEKENDVNQVNYYEITNTALIKGYMSPDISIEDVEKTNLLTKVGVNIHLESELYGTLV
jgi:hypothetical protein